jgi:hypothetical protein
MRLAAFEQVRQLDETHDHLSANQLGQGFSFAGERVPLYNPQRGIFKPQKMRFLLSIRTVFPKKGNRVWYDKSPERHGVRRVIDLRASASGDGEHRACLREIVGAGEAALQDSRAVGSKLPFCVPPALRIHLAAPSDGDAQPHEPIKIELLAQLRRPT